MSSSALWARPRGAICSLVCLSLLGACGSSTSSVDAPTSDARDGRAGSDGAVDSTELAAGGHDGSAGGDAGQQADAASHPDASLDHTMDSADAADGSACGTLVNISPAISATTISTVPHTYQGGTLVDGTYVLFAVEETIASAPAMFKRTLRISSSGTAFEWIIDDPGLPPEHHFAGAITVSGPNATFADQCTGANLVYPFDASGTTLTLYYLVGPAGGRIFQYHMAP